MTAKGNNPRKSNKNHKYLLQFAKTLMKLRKVKDICDFLTKFLTPQELEQIPKRLEIVALLKKGASQREIVKKLGVGIATVSRGARELRLERK